MQPSPVPAPRERGESDALSGHFVDLASDVLEADDAVAQEMAVAWFPEGEVLGNVTAGVFSVFVDHGWHERAVGLRSDRRPEGMVERLTVDPESFDALLDEPGARLVVGARGLDKVFTVVAVVAMPAGIDDYDVAFADLRSRVLEVVGRDDLPFLLRDRDDHAGAEVGLRGTSSINRFPWITCAGASVCVVQCMKVVICCESTPDFAW